MPIHPPVYHGDQSADYRRLLITHSSKQAIDVQSIQTFLQGFGAKLFVEFTVGDLNVKVFNITNEKFSVDDAIAVLQPIQTLKEVAFERDVRLSLLQVATSDPLLRRQWALDKIETAPAWDWVAVAGQGRPPVSVAVVDSGAQANHQDFAGLPLGGRRVVPPAGPNFGDDLGHGTMLAGTIAAVSNNNLGVAGVASNPNRPGGVGPFPDLRLLAIKFDDARNPPTALSAAIGIVEAIVRGAQVINLSWHVLDMSGMLFAVMQAVGSLMPEVLFVAAAGNHGSNNARRPPTLPASYALDNILSVMASNEHDQKPGFSNYGTNVDIAAPGTRIPTTSIYYRLLPPERIHSTGYRVYSGTSAAAAHGSAAAALLLAIDDWTALQIRQHLIASADRVPGLRGLCRADGRLNLRRAVCGPFAIVSPVGGPHARNSPFNVQWNLEYNSPVIDPAVNTVELSIVDRASGAVVTVLTPVGGVLANTAVFPAMMPAQVMQNVAVRLRCLQRKFFADSAPFDVV